MNKRRFRSKEYLRTRKLYHLTSVQKRRRDGVESVRSTYEENLTEVDRYIDVMILFSDIALDHSAL
jgi:hypothetical protein